MVFILVCMKVIGVVLSGLFGIVGVIAKVRDASGAITSRGKVFILGSAIGFLMAVVSQIFETYIQQETERKSAEESLQSTLRLETIVNQLNRSLQPIESFEFYLAGDKISLSDPGLKAYRDRLDSGIEKYLRKNDEDRFKDKDFSTPLVGVENGKHVPLEIEVSNGSSYYPSDEEFTVRSAIFPMCYEFVFFKNPIDPNKYEPGSRGGSYSGDLQIEVMFPSKLSLSKDLRSGEYSVTGRLVASKDLWEDNSGRIVSIPDLAGAQMFYSMCNRSSRIENAFTSKEKRLPSVELHVTPGSMNIHMGKRNFWVKQGDFKPFKGQLRDFWEYRFPEDVSKIFKAQPE
jgi:hypothetical protein